jgi:signal transduction histidine kinase
VGARLTAIKFALEEKVSLMDEKMVMQSDVSLEQIVSMVRDTIEEIHKISTNLRPSLLDDLGIVATIHSVCRDFQEIQSDIQLKPKIYINEEEIPESLKIVIFRILQEALNNALKYSRSGTVWVSLQRTDGVLELSVEDNGIGFDEKNILSEESQTRGMGLGSMKERTELSNGSLEIQSMKGKGTKISATWRL